MNKWLFLLQAINTCTIALKPNACCERVVQQKHRDIYFDSCRCVGHKKFNSNNSTVNINASLIRNMPAPTPIGSASISSTSIDVLTSSPFV